MTVLSPPRDVEQTGDYTGAYGFHEDQPDALPNSCALPHPAAATLATPPTSVAASSAAAACEPSSDVILFRSRRLEHLGAQLPVNQDRPALVYSLMSAFGLLDEGGDDEPANEAAATPGLQHQRLARALVQEPPPASIAQLGEYHSRDYLAALAGWRHLSEAGLAAYGLQDDTPPFDGLLEYASLCAGGSLAAADALARRRCRVAVHLEGGRHHAKKSAAAGFCYVNDAVLAVLRLLESFRRVLYLDVDVHHGDAVEGAFAMTGRVCTVSLHKHAPGFFPGTGGCGDAGGGRGAGFALSLTLGDGLRDGLLLRALRTLGGGVVQRFRPDCVVLQCGCDGLAGDPVGRSWGLTPAAYAAAAAEAAGWGAPLLLLGGGGYDSAGAARAWTAALGALLRRSLPTDVPAAAEHFERYGPSYELYSLPRPCLAADTNTQAEVDARCSRLLGLLESGLAAQGAGRGPQRRKS